MAGRCRFRAGRGFTLVELLVVITIIGILVGLIMSAVQSARERARNAQCMNNLKQLANGAQQHESATGYLPSGGWGWYTIGDPDRGYGATQPGGWFYNLMPFIDLGVLHDLGANIPYGSAANAQTQTRINYAIQMIQTPQAIANCPTRRRPQLLKMVWGGTYVASNYGGVSNPSNNNVCARTDYAVCCGDGSVPLPSGYNVTEIDGGAGDPGWIQSGSVWQPNVIVPSAYTTPSPPNGSVLDICNRVYTGVCFRCSQIGVAQIKGGASNTILLGDKYDLSTGYYSGNIAAENENMYVGMDNDIFRATNTPPLSDRSTTDSATLFGSAHLEGCNFAFCDGSARPISYLIDPPTFAQLGRRVKTQPINDALVK
jgi:prepilin-type N-terminal cleavage/methylation domain-containing protein/prepilin-type processing-associated H-X9-DG protein